MQTKYESIPYHDVNWDELDSFEDRTIFQTSAWLELVKKTHQAHPIVAAIKRGNMTIGYFTGLAFRKFGVKIIGSPFKGWTTSYMGFNLLDKDAKKEALQALPAYVFNTLGCQYLELVDRNLSDADYLGLPYRVSKFKIQEVNLARTEDEIISGMRGNVRRNLHKSVRDGLVIEEAEPQGFAEEYYDQLLEVFGKQNLIPTYSVERVRALVDEIHPTGNLLLLRAKDSEGRPIASGIFLGYNKRMYFWGGASYQKYQFHRPNEAIMWYAIRYWKQRGVVALDLGGYAHYKEKYGPDAVYVPALMLARHNSLFTLRDTAYKFWSVSWKLVGKLKARYQPGQSA